MNAYKKDAKRDAERRAIALLASVGGKIDAALRACDDCADHDDRRRTILIEDGDTGVTAHCRACSIEGEPLDDVRRLLETERGPIAIVMTGGKTIVVLVRPKCVCGGDVGRVERGAVVCGTCGAHGHSEPLAS